jgi:hypothetical protein
MTDIEIRQMYKELGMSVRRIVHGDQCRHVYFWENNDTIQEKALDKAYKLKGHYAPEKKAVVNLNVDVNNEEGQAIAEKYENELKNALLD